MSRVMLALTRYTHLSAVGLCHQGIVGYFTAAYVLGMTGYYDPHCHPAALAREFHGAGFTHRDLYLCHLLVRPDDGADPALHLIDLARVQYHRRGAGRRRIVKDLAALLFSSEPSPATDIRSKVFTRADRMRFACEYFGARPLTGGRKDLVRSVIRKAAAIAGHERRRRARSGAAG
jgi:hypothetical protein